MAERVVRLGDADLRVGHAALLAADHERDDPRHVRLIGEDHQVEHEPRVLLVGQRNARRRRDRRQLAVGLLLGELDAPLDAADGLEVLVELPAVVGGEARLEMADLPLHRVEDAPLLLDAAATRLGARVAHVAEQALEDDARVGLARHRRRAVGPRVVEVGATEAPVARRHAVHGVAALERELQRRQLGRAADALGVGRDLVHRDAQLEGRARGAPRARAGQERRRRLGVGRPPARLGPDAVEVGHHEHALADRGERLQARRPLEVGAGRLRLPVLDRGAVRHDDDAEALRGRRRGPRQRRQRRHHPVEERQRQRRSDAAQHRPARDYRLGHDHQPILLV